MLLNVSLDSLDNVSEKRIYRLEIGWIDLIGCYLTVVESSRDLPERICWLDGNSIEIVLSSDWLREIAGIICVFTSVAHNWSPSIGCA